MVEAEATGVAVGDIIEFFLISAASSHDYEALAMTRALPSDVGRALAYIGLPPGQAIEPNRNRFWPKGERVTINVLRAGQTNSLPVESLLSIDPARRKKGRMHFVFVGGPRKQAPDGTMAFAVDKEPPGSIVSNYNEPITVLDVAAAAPQSDVYRTQIVSTNHVMKKGEKLSFIIQPVYQSLEPHAIDLQLRVIRPAPKDGKASSTLRYVLTGPVPDLPVTDDFIKVMAACNGLVERGFDPFVTLEFGPGVPIGLAADVCRLLASIESDRGIRMEPAPEGQLFYRAFLPNLDLVQRDKRIAQPWELHWSKGDAPVTLLRCKETWRDDKPRPELTLIPRAPADPQEAVRIVGKEEAGAPALMVFAPPYVAHGDLMKWVGPLRKQLPYVHVVSAMPGKAPDWRPALVSQ